MASKKDYLAIARIIKNLTTEEGDIAQGYLMEELIGLFRKG